MLLREWALGDRLHEWRTRRANGSTAEDKGLADWDISRDEPYFVSRSPTRRASISMWSDAPIGYLASLKAHLARSRIDFAAFLGDPDVEQVHFIGKDIVPPHAVLAGDAQVRRPAL